MLLLEKVFEVINNSGLDYCIQNKYEMMPEVIPSDIDMMYRNASEKDLDKIVVDVAKQTDLIITQKIVQGDFEFTYILTPPVPTERFQLQLDFYRSITKKGYLNVMPAEDMLETKRFYKCFYVPDKYVELKYMFIRRTIKNDMDEGHIDIAKELYDTDRENYKSKFAADFSEQAADLMEKIVDSRSTAIFYDNIDCFRSAVKGISKRNSDVKKRIKNFFFVLFWVMPKRVFRTCGISVAFLAPDGGGKSTVIDAVSETVSGSFYGQKRLYLRPHLFKNLGGYNPINPTEEDATNPDPHGKKVNGVLKSLVRFFFYNLDYLFGHLRIVLPLKIKKKLVIFDRYYYDYYVDMKRYMFKLPTWFAKAFSWFIPRPNIIFVLDADAQTLYNRKQELPVEELERQSAEYRRLGMKMKNAVLVDATQPVEKVTADVTRQILLYKARKTAKLLKIKVDENGRPI